MKKNFLRLLAFAGFTLTPAASPAQDQLEPSLAVDFVSHYMWRGTDKGGISIQPSGQLSWKGLYVGITSCVGLESTDPQELDLSLGYTIGGFNIGITDYWQKDADYAGLNRYFYYDPKLSAHQFEGNIGYTCRYFSLQAYTMFWGDDYKYETAEDHNQRENGKRAYSTFIQLRVPFYLAGLDWDLSAALTPFESAGYATKEMVDFGKGEERADVKNYFYASGPACVMASLRATKQFTFGDVKMPAFAEFHANPYTQKACFLVGVTVKPF